MCCQKLADFALQNQNKQTVYGELVAVLHVPVLPLLLLLIIHPDLECAVSNCTFPSSIVLKSPGYLRNFGSKHDLLGHDVEGAALSLVRDHGVEDVRAVHLFAQEYAGDKQLVARLANLEFKS